MILADALQLLSSLSCTDLHTLIEEVEVEGNQQAAVRLSELDEVVSAHLVTQHAAAGVDRVLQPHNLGEGSDGPIVVQLGRIVRGHSYDGFGAVNSGCHLSHFLLPSLLQNSLLVGYHLVGLSSDLYSHSPLSTRSCLGAKVQLRWQQTQQLVKLDQSLLQLLVLLNFELHSDHIAVDTICIEHWLHRQQVLEHLSILSVVGELDVAILSLRQGVADDLDCLGFGLGSLQESAVAADSFLLGVKSSAAELFVDIHHGCSGNGHV